MKTKSTAYLAAFALTLGLALVSCRQEESFYTNVLRSDVFYQTYEEQGYDFLWVFDNSASMDSRRKYVKDNLQTFLNILNSRKAIDYQMAMVTTDYFSHNGDLVESPTGLKVVQSTASNPVSDFASIINNIADSPTSFWEQGMESAYQAVYKHRGEFMRAGMPLILVFLTDENDWSCKDNCFGVEPENNTTWIPWDVSRYIDYFTGVKSAENSLVSVFPIIGMPGSSECEIASSGDRYQALEQGVGNFGTSGSICNGSLQQSYENIARTIADRGVRFTLSSKASGKGISVFVDQQLIPFSPENYIYEEESNSIIFTGAVPKTGSIVEVAYSELTD